MSRHRGGRAPLDVHGGGDQFSARREVDAEEVRGWKRRTKTKPSSLVVTVGDNHKTPI